jgi:hypothetical protein
MSGNSDDGDVDVLLQISSTDRRIEIPRKNWMERLDDAIDEDVNTALAAYKRRYFTKKQEELKKVDLQFSPLSIGLYNAVVDTKSGIPIQDILNTVENEGLASEGGIKVTEFTVRYGKFSTAVKYTSEYGLKIVKDIDARKYVSADFQLKITRGSETKGASFSFYKSGKIRFSSGYFGTPDNLEEQPRKLLEFMSAHYFRVSGRPPILLNNIASDFRIGYPIKANRVYDLFSDRSARSSFDGRDLFVNRIYENKKHLLYISFWNGAAKPIFKNSKAEQLFSITIAENGTVQIQGTDKVKETFNYLKKFLTVLKDNDYLETSGAQRIKMASPKKTKASRRAENVPAPNITRRGTTCPLARRPDPYSFEGKCKQTGCYIKPNPQGQPCCYTVPKSIEYSRNKVTASYNKAGVKVPAQVRTLFGFGQNTNNRPVNVANKNVELRVRTYVNKSGFKIDSRQCLRYTKVALVDIAQRLGVPMPKKLTKPILCNLIKGASKLPNVSVKAGNKVISGMNANLRLGSRLCSSYNKNTLVKIARELGGVVDDEMDKPAICKLIETLSKTRRNRLQANFNRKKVADKEDANRAEENRKKSIANAKKKAAENKKAADKAEKNALLAEKRKNLANEIEAKKKARYQKVRMTRELVKANLGLNNANVNRAMNAINRALQNGTIKKTKTGFPLKTSFEKFKKDYKTNSNENFNYFMRGPST